MKRKIPLLSGIPWIGYGFYTRINCAWNHGEEAVVRENRAKVAADAGFREIVTLRQVHGADVLDAAAAGCEGDALVTAAPGVCIGVLTADCAPVLFASRRDKVVGAAHAGWKGAIGGVLENTVAKMEDLGAARADIVAVVGPCIGPASYEVGAGFERPFMEQDAGNAWFFRPSERAGHLMFDLPGYAAHRLKLCGVGEVYDIAQDTFTRPDLFFSHRRFTKGLDREQGRQASVIGIVAG